MEMVYSFLTNKSNLDNIAKVGKSQLIKNKARVSYQAEYTKAKLYKAFAQSVTGSWSWKSNRTSTIHAMNNALIQCRKNNRKNENNSPCKIINVDDKWIETDKQITTIQKTPMKGNASIIKNSALKSYTKSYLKTDLHKAFAQSKTGSWSWKSKQLSKNAAIKKALSSCKRNNKKNEKVPLQSGSS